MTVSDLISKVKGVPSYVKEHWNTPGEGEYLSLKEIVAYTLTQSGSYVFLTASGIVTFSASYFCGAILEIANKDFYIINLVSTILSYVLMFMNPVGVLIYENHGVLTKKMSVFAHACYLGQMIVGGVCYFLPQTSFEFIINGLPQLVGNMLFVGGLTGYITWGIRRKFCAKYGRLKPFILLCGIPSAILVSVIPYLPVQNMTETNKLIVLHFAFTLMNYFYNSYVGVNGMVAFMSPNSQERQKLHSYVPIVTGLFPSIINMFFPMLITITGGYLNIKTYKVFVPIFAFIGALMSLAVVLCHERIIEPPVEQRKRVTFLNGAKQVLKNKYFWIVNVSNVIGQWQGLVGNLLSWWFIYSLRQEAIMGVVASVVVVGMTPGNLLCPFLTKRFQKRNILLASRAVMIATVFGMLFAVKTESIIIFVISLFLKNSVQPIVDGVNVGLGADIQDYHQWKYGERADSMSGVFSWFLSPLNLGIGYIMPWLLELMGFTSDWDVLYDSRILNNVFSLYTWGSILGLVLLTVPFIFYDLTREKHDKCIDELKARVVAQQESADELQEVEA